MTSKVKIEFCSLEAYYNNASLIYLVKYWHSLPVSFKQKKVKTNFGKFVNPYQHRSNGGIPIFSQERILERAKKVIIIRCSDPV